jgi:hypothetical protein
VAYEQFERKSVRVDVPILSIAPGGRVAINAAACRLLIAAGIKNVVILWDKTANRMAVKAAPKREKNSFTVSFAKGSHSASFRAKSFLNHIGWSAPKRIGLDTTWNAAERMFEVSLPPMHLAPASSDGKRGVRGARSERGLG